MGTRRGRRLKPIALGADHAGFRLKEAVKRYLDECGLPFVDYGTFSEDSVDYPEYGKRVGEAVASRRSDRGIVVCGSGLGIAIAANKIRGVRAAPCRDRTSAYLCRAHNDANVLALGGRLTGWGMAREIVKAWLGTPFEGGRHVKRLRLIRQLERGR